MKIIEMGTLTFIFGLVVTNVLKCHFIAPLWWRDSFRIFLCAFICRHDTTNGYRFTFALGSRYVGHSSVSIRKYVGRLHAIRCYVGLDSVLNRPWIGVRSADICPIHNWSKTDKPSTIGGRIKNDTSPNAPRQNRQICLPEHKPTPNRQNRINTNIKSICPRIWWFLSVWGRFRVGLAGVTVVLGRVTHTCVNKLTIVGSDNGLSPVQRLAVIWTNAGILLIGHMGTKLNEIRIEVYTF